MREYRGTGGERMAIRNNMSTRPDEPPSNRGDKWVGVVALIALVLWVIFVERN